MAQQSVPSVMNNFTAGLKTEFTGLNFPENAATDTDNCSYDLIGNVARRRGINYEENNNTFNTTVIDNAISNYMWNNAGGTGNVQLQVVQVGGFLYFYDSSIATVSGPLSSRKIASSINLANFAVDNTITDYSSIECSYSSGNGYLFVYHPKCDPFYCLYSAGAVTAKLISVQIRDFVGVVDVNSPKVETRPLIMYNEHLYNLVNQGWSQGSPWTTESTTLNQITTGVKTFQVDFGLTINLGDIVMGTVKNIYVDPTHPYQTPGRLPVPGNAISGTVTGYVGNMLTVNITDNNPGSYPPDINGSRPWSTSWTLYTPNFGYINTWKSDVGNYPSNADIWWTFKDSTGNFNPAGTLAQIPLNSTPAPMGHFILNAFNQSRTSTTGIQLLNDRTTRARPKTGTWFQGRVWYAGVDDAAQLSGNAKAYVWSETLYFSQIITDETMFGLCYQTNDPTSETLFDVLPTDGGTIQIQGCGSIYKLFPIQNGMLVFAANGIWFITGSQGIGFTANDYTITKISSVQSISSTSFVDVQGLPIFWNEEGIYQITPTQGGALSVDPVTVSTIRDFYESIPTSSKKFARGTYHPIDYVVQWVYNSDDSQSLSNRYTFDKILNYNTYNKAFYPYSLENSEDKHILGLMYIPDAGKEGSPDSQIKYLAKGVSDSNQYITWADEHDETYKDWGEFDYESYFVTGYSLKGQALRKFQVNYIYVFSDNLEDTTYKIQSCWDYANTGNSGRWSSRQLINNSNPMYGVMFRRHRLRGNGLVLQIKVTSVQGKPFDIIGWSLIESVNAGI